MTSDSIDGWVDLDPAGAFLAGRRKVATAADRWYVYQCRAMDSPHLGNVFFLLVGPERTYKEPPPYCPGPSVIHAMSPLVGWLDLDTGGLRQI